MNIFKKSLPKTEEYTSDYRALLKQFEAVVEINNAMTGVLARDEILNLVNRKLISVLDVAFANILVWSEVDRSLSVANISAPKAAVFLTEKALGRPFSSIKFYADKDKTNDYIKCIESNEIIQTKNLSSLAEPLLNSGVSGIVQGLLNMKLAVSVPLYVRDQKLGVLGLIWNKDELSSQDLALIKTFATQISNTLYNSVLFNRVQTQVSQLEIQNKDLASLFNLSSEISKSLDPIQVAQSAVNSLPQNDFMAGGMILDYDEEKGETWVEAVTQNELAKKLKDAIGGFDKYKVSINSPEAQESPVVRSIKTQQLSYSDNIEDVLHPLPKRIANIASKLINIKSVVSYPILARGKVVGAVAYFLKEKTYDQLDENKKQLFNTYTLQITIALENAHLYAESQATRQNLEDALYQLKEARRLEKDMIDVMGHELRTPISIVRNALVMVEKQLKQQATVTSSELHKYMDMALESTRREITLIETLLSATKVDASRMQLHLTKVDLKDVINDGIEGQTAQLEKKQGVHVNYNPPVEDISLFADRTRMQEIMDNLYSNAVKYTLKGNITISAWKDKDFGWLNIADQGIGISAEDLQNLGKKFFRAKQYIGETGDLEDTEVVRPGGTGLGLYVTYDLVRIMGGTLYINSEVGKGSTFTVCIPLHKGQDDKQIDETFDTQEQRKKSHIMINKPIPKPI